MVRQGDNWFNLAQRYNVSPSELAKANGDIKKLLPGQTIVIPGVNKILSQLATRRASAQPQAAAAPQPGERREPQAPPPPQPKPATKAPGQAPTFKPPVFDPIAAQYGAPPAGIPSDVWRQMQTGTQQGMGQIARPNFAPIKPAAPQPKPTYQYTTPAGPPASAAPNAPAAPKSSAAQQVLANIAAAKSSGKAFSITEQERVAAEWKILNPGQPVPVFSQAFLQRLSNADNAADYQRILQNWSASAGGVGAKDLNLILLKAYNDPTYPWPKAIMPYEVAKYNVDKSLLEQLYAYDPQLGYYVLRTNVQGSSGADIGTGGGGGGSSTAAQGFTGSGGMPTQQGRGGYSNNGSNQAGMLGLINWRF